MKETNKGQKKTQKLTLAQYVQMGYTVKTKAVYLDDKDVKLADVVVRKGDHAVFLPGVIANKNVPDTAHLTLAEYVRLGYAVETKKLYVSEAGLPAADVLVKKPGERSVYLNGIFGKDALVPGGKRHRFGETAKHGVSPETRKANARAKSARANNHQATTAKDPNASAKSAGTKGKK
jgi:hypothetical protein